MNQTGRPMKKLFKPPKRSKDTVMLDEISKAFIERLTIRKSPFVNVPPPYTPSPLSAERLQSFNRLLTLTGQPTISIGNNVPSDTTTDSSVSEFIWVAGKLVRTSYVEPEDNSLDDGILETCPIVTSADEKVLDFVSNRRPVKNKSLLNQQMKTIHTILKDRKSDLGVITIQPEKRMGIEPKSNEVFETEKPRPDNKRIGVVLPILNLQKISIQQSPAVKMKNAVIIIESDSSSSTAETNLSSANGSSAGDTNSDPGCVSGILSLTASQFNSMLMSRPKKAPAKYCKICDVTFITCEEMRRHVYRKTVEDDRHGRKLYCLIDYFT